MKIKYLGHSAFALTSQGGTRIVLDPFDPGAYDGAISYPPVNETAEIVLLSHGHADHGYAEAVKGNPKVISCVGSASVGEVKITGVRTFHDDTRGSQRGRNVVFTIETDGLRLTHLGDLGHPLSDTQAAEIGTPDILLVPVGGFFTIDASTAWKVADRLEPRIVIPMHYKTECCGFSIAPLHDFLKGKEGIKRVGQEVEVSAASLPEGREIWVMEYPRP